MTVFNVVSLAGGLGFFLYGMTIMGNGLEKAVGDKTQGILQRLTSSTFKGVLLGTLITALIQSSAGTTVIAIGLVNSGILQFSQALGVVMGANIGTTITAQILRLTDISGDSLFLQLLSPTTLAPLMALAGAMLFVFSKRPKKQNVGQILIGFGILFFGMFAMEDAVLPLRDSPLFIEMFAKLQNPLLGILAGAIVTAAIQSSTASVGILQALSATGFVTWGSAVPIIFGQNIGTCVTGLIASAGASRSAKRVAISHLYFNVIGTGLFMAVLYFIKAAFGLPFWGSPIDKGGIANFHTLFNVITTLIFIPFSQVLVKLSEWTVPEKEGDTHPELAPLILDTRLYASPSVAIAQARQGITQMGELGQLIQRAAVPLLFDYDAEKAALAQQREELIDRLEVSISNYLVNMNKLDLNEFESREVTTLLHYIVEFERIGDYAINVVERGGEAYDKEVVFTPDAQHELQVLQNAITEVLDLALTAFINNDINKAQKVEPLEEVVNQICESLRSSHINRLNKGNCTINAGIIFLEVLTDYERISDHCSNVAARLRSLEENIFDIHEMRRQLREGNLPLHNRLKDHYTEKYIDRLDEQTPDMDGVLQPS